MTKAGSKNPMNFNRNGDRPDDDYAGQDAKRDMQTGMSLFTAGKYTEALECFFRVFRIVPDDPFLLHTIGSVYGASGKTEEAISWFDKALAIDPQHYKALWDKGFTLDRIGKHDEAIACYDKILQFKPDDIRVLEDKSNSKFSSGKYEEALALCNKILEMDPKHKATYLTKTFCLQKLKRPQEAQECFEKMQGS
jgi:tetratricopeptide (TPR) repeat protein